MRLCAAFFAFSVTTAASVTGAFAGSWIKTGAETSRPYGHDAFCKSNPRECARQRDAGMEKLTAYGEGRTEEWSRLLGLAGAVKPLPKVDPWIAARAGRLQGSLPATGATLRGLMEQLGLHVE